MLNQTHLSEQQAGRPGALKLTENSVVRGWRDVRRRVHVPGGGADADKTRASLVGGAEKYVSVAAIPLRDLGTERTRVGKIPACTSAG